jgi:hypothetical protein
MRPMGTIMRRPSSGDTQGHRTEARGADRARLLRGWAPVVPLGLVVCLGLGACSHHDDGPRTAATADEVVDGLHRRGVVIAYNTATRRRNDLDRSRVDDHLAYFRTVGAHVTVLLYRSAAALDAGTTERARSRPIDDASKCGSVLVLYELVSGHRPNETLAAVKTTISNALTEEYGPECERARLRTST